MTKVVYRIWPKPVYHIWPKYRFYVVTCYIYQKAFCHLPVAMDLSCVKTLSNRFPDRTAHGLVSSNQKTPRLDVIMARRKPPVPAYYGTGPFNFTISHNCVNTNSITSVRGSNDGKTCTLYIGTSALFPHWVLSNLSLLYWSVQTWQDLSTTTCTWLNFSLAEKYISSLTMAYNKPYSLRI